MAHDGDISGFKDFFNQSAFKGYSATQGTDIAAYNLCFFDTGYGSRGRVYYYAPYLYGRELHGADRLGDARIASQIAGNIDLIGRGTIQGKVHGLLYQPASSNYISDANAVAAQAQL